MYFRSYSYLLLSASQSPKPATPKKKTKPDQSKSKPGSARGRGRPRKNQISLPSKRSLRRVQSLPYLLSAKSCDEETHAKSHKDVTAQGMLDYILFLCVLCCRAISEITVDLRFYKYTNATDFKKDLKKRTATETQIWTISLHDPFDTFNAQLLVRAENFFKPPKINLVDYNIFFTIPRASPTPVAMDEDGYKAFRDRVVGKSKPIIYVLQKSDTPKDAQMVCLIASYSLL